MYVSDYTVQLLHQDRLRDAERRQKLYMLRDATEQAPNMVEAGLVYQIKQLLRSKNRQQEVRDVRRATAV